MHMVHFAGDLLDYRNDSVSPVYSGGSRISGKGVHMCKGVGFALLILYYSA